MTVYVDELVLYEAPAFKFTGYWCHLMTDGPVDELHNFADKIGLKLAWFQDKPRLPHYDLTRNKRREAIRAGAVPVSAIEMIRRCRTGV